ncbi:MULTISPECIES: hypothetical protein [unclassified Haloarcula]|uniref:hypothetical protein n=1 Tax=unclassified Haloarcula TaxID=2624677 RepID=UPI001246B390|nr:MULTISPECIES: hypothetical protein [unclassified Haloarcula]
MSSTHEDENKNTIGIVHQDGIEWVERDNGGQLVHRWEGLGQAADGEKLGCTLYEVPSGKRPHPYHCHYGTKRPCSSYLGMEPYEHLTVNDP